MSLTYQSQLIRVGDFSDPGGDYYSTLNSVYLSFVQSFERAGSLDFTINYYSTEGIRKIAAYQLRYQDIPLGKSRLDIDWGYLSYPLSSLWQFGSFNAFTHRSLKGGKLSLRSEKIDLFVFGGQPYSGSTQNDKKRLYGVRAIFKPTQDWNIGAGWLKFSESIPGSYDIFSLDSSIRLAKELYFLGDFRSIPSTNKKEEQGFSLKTGAYFRNRSLFFEIFYNYVSPDFPFLGNVLPQERKGLTIMGQYQPNDWLSVFGGLDTFNENLGEILDDTDYINDYVTYRCGINLSPKVFPQISFSFNRSKRKTETSEQSPSIFVSDTTFDLIFISLSKQYKRFYWHLYYNNGRFKNWLESSESYSLNRLQLNLRRRYSVGGFIYLNFLLDKKTGSPLVSANENLHIRAGGNHKISSDLNLNLEAGLDFSKDKTSGKQSRNLGLGGSIIYKFKPLKINCSLRYWYSRMTDSAISMMKNEFNTGKYMHQVFFSVSKDLDWGSKDSTGGLGGLGDLFARKGKIQGRIFVDINQNNLKDPEEEGVADIFILLDGRKTAKSNQKGHFVLSSLPPGLYRVAMNLRNVPAFYNAGIEEVEVMVKKGETHHVNLTIIPVGLISGKLILDENENNRADKDEPALPGIRINLLKGKEIHRSGFTDSTGVFTFDNLHPGTYALAVAAEDIEETYTCFEKSGMEIMIEPFEEIRDLVLIVKKYKKPKTRKVIEF